MTCVSRIWFAFSPVVSTELTLLRDYSPSQIELWMTEREVAYRGESSLFSGLFPLTALEWDDHPPDDPHAAVFGFVASLMERIPLVGIVFSISNRIGAAMWAHDVSPFPLSFASELPRLGFVTLKGAHNQIPTRPRPARETPTSIPLGRTQADESLSLQDGHARCETGRGRSRLGGGPWSGWVSDDEGTDQDHCGGGS